MGWVVRLSLPPAPNGASDDAAPVTARLWELGTTGVAELTADDGSVVLVAGFVDEASARAAASAPLPRPDRPAVRVEPVDDRVWTEAVPTAVVELAGRPVEIEVGPAFGHGRHPTTALALDLVTGLTGDRVWARRVGSTSGRTGGPAVLDVGTGTGVLALAALAAGAAAVTAVDNDPAALAVAGANLARHRRIGRPGSEPSGDGDGSGDRAGGAGPRVELADDVTAVAGRFELVVANVLAPVQLALASALEQRLAPGGRLVLSGFLADQALAVTSAHPTLVVTERRRHADWVALVLAGPDPSGPVR